MEQWNEHSEKIKKVSPNTEKSISLFEMSELIEQRLNLTTLPKFATLVVEDYYEIIKELITAIMSADGWKTVSHEMLIAYIAEFYPTFRKSEIQLMDQLRVMRNDIAYRGVMINPEFLKRNKREIKKIISKLKNILIQKL